MLMMMSMWKITHALLTPSKIKQAGVELGLTQAETVSLELDLIKDD